MFKKIQQRQSSSVPSLPLCTRHPSHQKMASLSLPPWIWTGLMTCHNPQNMSEVALIQFQTWPLRRWAAFMSSLLDASCHVRNPATRRHSHCEEVWASHAEKERCLTSQDVLSIPAELPFMWMKRASWTFYLLQHLQTTDEASEHSPEPNSDCRIGRNNKFLLF